MKMTRPEIAALARQIQQAGRDEQEKAEKKLKESFRQIAEDDFAKFQKMSKEFQHDYGRNTTVEDFMHLHYNNCEGINFDIKATQAIEDEITLIMKNCNSIEEIAKQISPIKKQ